MMGSFTYNSTTHLDQSELEFPVARDKKEYISGLTSQLAARSASDGIDYFNSRSPFRSLASYIALRARRRIYQHFVSLVGTNEGRSILDLGVTPDTKLPDSNFLELWYPHRSDITMASVEDCSSLEMVFPGTTFLQINPDLPLPFPDRRFDIGFSSAVLEHVGGTTQQLFYLKELARTCRSVFLTTPDRTFPIEVHTFFPFLHWLPKGRHRQLLSILRRHFWASETNLNLLTRRELSALVIEALRAVGRGSDWSISSFRLLGLSSNLVLWIPADRTA
jgi:hypothetical protein